MCIESIIELGGRKIIVCPFGEIGMRTEQILERVYKIKPYAIIDNHLYKYNDEIKPLEYLGGKDCSEFCVILATTNIDLYGELEKGLRKYIKAENIFALQAVLLDERTYRESKTKIGNDVWLGRNVIITEGVTIGNGAIAGAGAVITKDVPDYAIVAGIPAKVIRFRYTDSQIDALNKIRWWDWTDEQISERYNDFYLDVDDFIKKYL